MKLAEMKPQDLGTRVAQLAVLAFVSTIAVVIHILLESKVKAYPFSDSGNSVSYAIPACLFLVLIVVSIIVDRNWKSSLVLIAIGIAAIKVVVVTAFLLLFTMV